MKKDLPIFDIVLNDQDLKQGVGMISLVDSPAIGVNWIKLRNQLVDVEMSFTLTKDGICLGCPPTGDGNKKDGTPDKRCGDGVRKTSSKKPKEPKKEEPKTTPKSEVNNKRGVVAKDKVEKILSGDEVTLTGDEAKDLLSHIEISKSKQRTSGEGRGAENEVDTKNHFEVTSKNGKIQSIDIYDKSTESFKSDGKGDYYDWKRKNGKKIASYDSKTKKFKIFGDEGKSLIKNTLESEKSFTYQNGVPVNRMI